jgi:membrane-associated phospholipid phosphatase
MIGFSRLFLGAHFPHDVLVGWFFGAILLWAFSRFWNPIAAWLAGKSFGQQVLIAFLGSVVFIVLGLGVTALRSGYQLPESWLNNAMLVQDEAPYPVDPNGTFTSAGTFFGLGLGLAWINSRGGYQASGPVWRRALRYVIGLIGVLILWMGLGAVFPRGESVLVFTLRYFRYTLVGWWVTGGAPWVFQHFKLSTSSAD